MRATFPTVLLAFGCVGFVAGCTPAADPAALRHPALGIEEQAHIRGRCEAEVRERMGPVPASAPIRPCPEDGDLIARDRCRTNADLAMIAQTRYINRMDADIGDCLRRAGFR